LAEDVIVLPCRVQPGEILECVADCATFEADDRRFCTDPKKTLPSVKTEGTAKRVQVRF